MTTSLAKYRDAYMPVHGYLGLVVCAFGVITNILNIIVMTHKKMKSPINILFVGIAVADLVVLLIYMPYLYHFCILEGLNRIEVNSYSWMVFAVCRLILAYMNHVVAIYLTIIVAVWRLIAVKFPLHAARFCTIKNAKTSIFLAYIISIILNIPLCLTYSVKQVNYKGSVVYGILFSDMSQLHDKILEKTSIWIAISIFKLIPCILLIILSMFLIRVLYIARINRRKLLNNSTSSSYQDKTTKVVFIVLFVFLVSEMPDCILLVMKQSLDTSFYFTVYLNLRETLELFWHANKSINFIIYYTLIRQFRETFTLLFKSKISKIFSRNEKLQT